MRTAYISFSATITEKSVQTLISTITDQLARRVEHMYFLFSTPGGYVIPGFHLMQFIRALPIQTTMHNLSVIGSMGPPIFMAAQTRYAVPYSGFMFHSVGTYPSERVDARFIEEEKAAIDNSHARYIDAMTRDSKLTKAEMRDLLYGPKHLQADWALKKGVIHEIRDLEIPPGATIIQPSF